MQSSLRSLAVLASSIYLSNSGVGHARDEIGQENSTSHYLSRRGNLPAIIDLVSLNPTQGSIIQGGCTHLSGFSIIDVGDINGDGRADVIIAVPDSHPNGKDRAGTNYIIYGNNSVPFTFNLDTLTAAQGVIIQGANVQDAIGSTPVSSAGDVNGDGFNDVIMGFAHADPKGRANAGITYVVYGGDDLPGTIDLASLKPSQGIIIQGAARGVFSGMSVSNAGDVNKDGFADMVIGAPYSSPILILLQIEKLVLVRFI